MSRQFWQESLFWATANGTAVSNTATETILFPNVTIPGNYMQDGRCLRLSAHGTWGNTVTIASTLIFRVRWGGVGGTLIMASPAIVTPATATTAAIWNLDCIIQTRSNGSAGTVFGMGTVSVFEDAAATFGTVGNYGVVQPMSQGGVTTPAVATLDLTADTALSLTVQWDETGASNTITGHIYLGESLN
jgi:hypothetical protein